MSQFFWEQEAFRTTGVEEIRTHILCSITFSRKSCLCEIMWKNTAEADRPQITGHMRFACPITKAKDIHSEYVMLTAFPRQQWLLKRASLLRCTYIACLVIICVPSFNTAIVHSVGTGLNFVFKFVQSGTSLHISWQIKVLECCCCCCRRRRFCCCCLYNVGNWNLGWSTNELERMWRESIVA